MDNLTPYWEALRLFGIEGPCRVFLAGPFEADEVALRFILNKLGFTLLDRWNARAAQWVVCGESSEWHKAPSTNEQRLAPALFQVESPFHLLREDASSQQRRHSLFRLLKNEDAKNIKLGFTLMENGGADTSLMEEVLAAFHLHHQDEEKQGLFLRHLAPLLPDEVLELLREAPDSLPFRLGLIREQLPRFSPHRFLKLMEGEHYVPLENNEFLTGLYSDKAEDRERTCREISKTKAIHLPAEQLWIPADLPQGGGIIELQGELSLEGPPRPECLEKLLRRHPGFFANLKSIIMKRAGLAAIHIIGPEALRLEALKLEVPAPLSIAALLEEFSTSSLRKLDIQSTHRRTAVTGLPSQAHPGATSMAPNLRELSISGFRSLNLDGIELFRNLKALTLIDNRLKALPSGIGALHNLEELYLFEKELESLPGSFYKLPLKKIWLGPNQLPEHTKVLLEKAFPAEAFQWDQGLG